MKQPRKIVVAVLAIASLAVAGVAVAYATGVAFTPSGGVIHACVNVENGGVRVLDPQSGRQDLQQCRANETGIDWSQVGPPGPGGADGAPGPAGSNGVSGYEVVTATSPIVLQGRIGSATATCPTGKVPVGGGNLTPYVVVPPPTNVTLYDTTLSSYPNGSGWTVTIFSGYGGAFTVYAVCVSA
jgi:hypothetical protein